MDKHMGIADLRSQLGKRVDAAHFRDEWTVIEKNGEPRAVLVSYEWWGALKELAGRVVEGDTGTLS